MKKRTVKIFLTLFSVIVSLLIGEFIVGKYKHQMTYAEAYFYQMKCYVKDDLLPFSLPKNYSCLMRDYNGVFNIRAQFNSLGYRGKEFLLNKPPNTTRILVLGDSFTFGIGVSDEETYPYQLEKILKEKGHSNTEVINAGYADAFSPDSYYLYLKKRGLALKPDIVILGFFVYNDISDLAETVWEKADKDGLPEKISSCCHVVDGGILRNKMIDFKYKYPILRDSQLFLLVVNTLNARFKLFKNSISMPTKDELKLGCVMSPDCIHLFSAEEEKTYKVLKGIKDITQKENIPFLVVLIPLDHQLNPKDYNFWFIDTNNLDFIQKRIGKNLSESRISYLDLYPIFDKQRGRGRPFLPKDLHFNALGGQITAESIASYLVENKLIK